MGQGCSAVLLLELCHILQVESWTQLNGTVRPDCSYSQGLLHLSFEGTKPLSIWIPSTSSDSGNGVLKPPHTDCRHGEVPVYTSPVMRMPPFNPRRAHHLKRQHLIKTRTSIVIPGNYPTALLYAVVQWQLSPTHLIGITLNAPAACHVCINFIGQTCFQSNNQAISQLLLCKRTSRRASV